MRRYLWLACLLTLPLTAHADVEIDGRRIEVIDVHLHTGTFGRLTTSGRSFVIGTLPPFARLYAPALVDHILDPWYPHLGIRAQTEWAGVDHALLLAVYAQNTTAHFENAALDQLLRSPSNDDWARGMVSINFEDWDPARLEALDSWLRVHPDRIVGIKLAHAHQGVAFDDPTYLGVYEVAARRGVPVLLHTGFSVAPGSRDEPEFIDPLGLASVIENYDGAHGMGRVDFVLSHVGQGDERATEHALELAEEHDNVWLELSALAHPALVDERGEPVEDETPQYVYVLDAVQERGLIDRTLFASDGPQYSGMVRGYVQKIIAAMQDADYSLDDIALVMGANARTLFFR